jgi:hypothetical protein
MRLVVAIFLTGRTLGKRRQNGSQPGARERGKTVALNPGGAETKPLEDRCLWSDRGKSASAGQKACNQQDEAQQTRGAGRFPILSGGMLFTVQVKNFVGEIDESGVTRPRTDCYGI